jgi:hypothetical protein
MVSNNKMRGRVTYRIALAVGEEVHGVAEPLLLPCQDASVSIPFCNVGVELNPPSGGNTRSDVCALDIMINREHFSPLVVAGVIV